MRCDAMRCAGLQQSFVCVCCMRGSLLLCVAACEVRGQCPRCCSRASGACERCCETRGEMGEGRKQVGRRCLLRRPMG
ncbi:uncharacterized protein BDZ83DRAFT_35144 [Colletotrichum acutatum]|uniref:Secreted protein n=1 Tax=Glomerella acutata TaxID=27357 RepID=A0AAD9D0A4_GLOAC|nr:uncharacterized protein BDZ83DRAFT_35144 [Colletotrichum acutatum]KAK1729534.1 hypothetical protein BDZ83DRAFT_35144 [Colletotrichum acutatum]